MPDLIPEALLRFVAAQPRQVGDLYAWGARRLYHPRMVRALVANLVEREQLAASDPVALADWSWVWHPEHASGPGPQPPLDLSPEALRVRVVEDEEPAEEEPEEDDERELPAMGDEEEEIDARERDQLRSIRPREVRAATIGVRDDKQSRRLLSLVASDDPHPGGRPQTRAECANVPRPCPYVSCRFHLYLDVEPSGAIKLNFPDIGVEEMDESCALDVADRGPHSLSQVGHLMNLTRERARQIETRGAMRMVEHAKRQRIRLEALLDGAPRENGLLTHALPPRSQRAEPGPRHLRLLDLVGEREWTVGELMERAEAEGWVASGVPTQVSELLAMGLIERLGRGRYRALPRREEAAE